MNEVEQQQLLNEVNNANNYQVAWDTCVGKFFDTKSEQLYDAFCNCSSQDPKALVDIRMQLNALLALKSDFEHFMSSGHMAKIQLDKENENDQ